MTNWWPVEPSRGVPEMTLEQLIEKLQAARDDVGSAAPIYVTHRKQGFHTPTRVDWGNGQVTIS